MDNLHDESLIAQRIVSDHMTWNQIKSYELKITRNLLKHVKEARSRYFSSLKEKSLHHVESQHEEKLKAITDEIVSVNEHIFSLELTICQLREDGDKFSFEAETKTLLEEIKSTIAKSNALKRTADDKEAEVIH